MLEQIKSMLFTTDLSLARDFSELHIDQKYSVVTVAVG